MTICPMCNKLIDEKHTFQELAICLKKSKKFLKLFKIMSEELKKRQDNGNEF
jgi:hypothetical protein